MTTKTMDGEEYLSNLESTDYQNYKQLFSDEYIKRSDTIDIVSDYFPRCSEIHKAVSELPTIDLSIIDKMIEEMLFKGNNIEEMAMYSHKMNALKELKDRLLSKK